MNPAGTADLRWHIPLVRLSRCVTLAMLFVTPSAAAVLCFCHCPSLTRPCVGQVGPIPSGLPAFRWPMSAHLSMRDIVALLPGALSMALVAYMESMTIAQTTQKKYGGRQLDMRCVHPAAAQRRLSNAPRHRAAKSSLPWACAMCSARCFRATPSPAGVPTRFACPPPAFVTHGRTGPQLLPHRSERRVRRHVAVGGRGQCGRGGDCSALPRTLPALPPKGETCGTRMRLPSI